MFLNHINQLSKEKLTFCVCFRRFKVIFPFNVILILIIHIEIDKKALFNDFRKWFEKI